MDAAQVKYQINIFEGAKHGFSNPMADERAKANGVDLAYNAAAEHKA
jgi:Dienelactone hydrolase family.